MPSKKSTKNKKNDKHNKIKTFHNVIPYTFIMLAVTIRVLSAIFNPISDCDETYNYWEPTSFLLKNYGMQTWEYSPEFALRSYSYLLPQYCIGLISLLITKSPIFTFFSIRIALSLTCLYCELYFVNSLTQWFGRETARICFLFLIFSSGMFNACSAYLPQQFVMCCMLISFGSFYRENLWNAIVFMGIAVIIGCWPFIGLLALPMVVHCVNAMSLLEFIKKVAALGAVLCAITMAIDFYFYRQIVIAFLNILLYNVHASGGDEGQNLYGVDDWSYYVKNLGFNFNIVFVLCLLSPFSCNIFSIFGVFLGKKVKVKNLNVLLYRLSHVILPFWIWYVFFSLMPHKEERFMFVIYPFIALNASCALTQCRLRSLGNDYACVRKAFAIMNVVIPNIKTYVLLVFVTFSMSRSVGQCVYYRAPLKLWTGLNDMIVNASDFDGNNRRYNVCVGQEWYRVPTSLLISDVANLKWMQSKFDGQLPAEFDETYNALQPFNDMNQEEMSRYVNDVAQECDYIVDLWESNSVLNYPISKYEKMEKISFLDRKATSGINRSFYIPMISHRYVKYANYVVLKRKQIE